MSKQFYAGHLLVLRISFVIGRERSGNNISLLLVMMYHLGVLEFAPMTICLSFTRFPIPMSFHWRRDN